MRTLDQLGLEPADELLVRRCLREPQGLVIVGGPHASGVRTSLAAMLGAARMHASAHQRRSLAAIALNDDTSAHRPLRAALASIPQGCLVLAQAHLERAAHAFAACRELGVAPDRLARHLLFVLVQRLVPALCPACRVADTSAHSRKALARACNSWLMGEAVHACAVAAQACANCLGTGYAGRALVYELLLLDSGVRTLAEAGVIGLEMEQALFADGRSLWDHGLRRVCRGQIALGDLQRAVREPV